MELKATVMGKHLAQHPYNRIKLLTAGVEVSGEKHDYILPFNQLIAINCKRGLVWGELEFSLPEGKVVRLHGTEWQRTRLFYHHLMISWQRWSTDMSEISARVLQEITEKLRNFIGQDRWLTRSECKQLLKAVSQAIAAQPLPIERLNEFNNCQPPYQYCLRWLECGEKQLAIRNAEWSQQIVKQHVDFFKDEKRCTFDISQTCAVVNGENSVMVLAGAGTGKTAVLAARVDWLLMRNLSTAPQILLLAFGRRAAVDMNERIQSRLQNDSIKASTFDDLALQIISQGDKKILRISKLETNREYRHSLLITAWQQSCSQRKSYARDWSKWLSEDFGWKIEQEFWNNQQIAKWMTIRLDRWLKLIHMHGAKQAAMIQSVNPEIRELFTKYLKLMAPILKVWKNALKEENAVDCSDLYQRAISVLDRGRFISPWKHILIDEFQDLSPQRAALLSSLRQQNKRTTLFAVGDDWQSVYRFSGAEKSSVLTVGYYFDEGERCQLDNTYRFNQRISEISNRFIQQNPLQSVRQLKSLSKDNLKSMMLLPESQLERLLNKMSGYVFPQARVLILARYSYLCPEVLDIAHTRWPGMNIEFMTIHASKGQQADYVILLGLKSGKDGFPARVPESVIENGLLPSPEEFPDAEERRLAYVAITRASRQVWMLFDSEQPSKFVEEFRRLGVPILNKI